MRQIEFVPARLRHNLRETNARFSIGGAHFARSFLLANQRSGICRRKMNLLGNEILAQQSRLPPPQLGQRIVGLARARLAMPYQVDPAQGCFSWSINEAAIRISPLTRRSNARKRSSRVCPL